MMGVLRGSVFATMHRVCHIYCSLTNGEVAQQLQSLLQVYEQCSGQMINKDKSAIMSSANARSEKNQEVMNALNILMETTSEKYLGLPV